MSCFKLNIIPPLFAFSFYGAWVVVTDSFCLRYGVDNIRELLGHKVDLNFIENNPAVRLEKD